MGSWMEKCAITGIPVSFNDDVIAFIIECSGDDWTKNATVASLPIYGKYDDYGTLSLDPSRKDYHSQVLTSFLNTRLTKDLKGKSEQVGFSLNLEETIQAVERGLIFSSVSYSINPVSYELIFVRRDAFNYLFPNVIDPDSFYRQPFTFDEFKDNINIDYVKSLKESESNAARALKLNNWFNNTCHRLGDGSSFLVQTLASDVIEINDNLVEEIYNVVVADWLLKGINKHWDGKRVKGSQSFNLTIFSEILKFSEEWARQERFNQLEEQE